MTEYTAYVVYWLIAANLIAFVQMVLDKRRAEAGMRRIPESTLLGWSWLGGAIGTYAASRIVRHKTRKQPFASQTVMLCAAEIVLLVFWALGLLDPVIAAALANLPRPA